MLERELVEGLGQLLPAGVGAQMNTGLGLDDDGGDLPAPIAETDQRTAGHLRMNAENLFAWLGEHRSAGCLQAFGDAPAEPEAAIGVKITGISHPMPDRAGWRGSSKLQIPGSKEVQ